MIMFSIPYKAVHTIEWLSVILTSFNFAVEKLYFPVAATFLSVAFHLVHNCGSLHVFGKFCV